jgi:hypothetical protein
MKIQDGHQLRTEFEIVYYGKVNKKKFKVD